jgi:hypothetical protein
MRLLGDVNRRAALPSPAVTAATPVSRRCLRSSASCHEDDGEVRAVSCLALPAGQKCLAPGFLIELAAPFSVLTQDRCPRRALGVE